MPRMLDLCCGLGGASAAMRDREWDVLTLDIEPQFNPDVVADVREWTYGGPPLDLIWASPPCVEFAREFMPWSRTGTPPDTSIVEACKRIIDQAQPRFWIIENVKGSVRWLEPILGRPAYVQNPWFLWGHFPPLTVPRIGSNKECLSSTASAERALIPRELSEAVANAIALQPVLL